MQPLSLALHGLSETILHMDRDVLRSDARCRSSVNLSLSLPLPPRSLPFHLTLSAKRAINPPYTRTSLQSSEQSPSRRICRNPPGIYLSGQIEFTAREVRRDVGLNESAGRVSRPAPRAAFVARRPLTRRRRKFDGYKRSKAEPVEPAVSASARAPRSTEERVASARRPTPAATLARASSVALASRDLCIIHA